MTIARGQHLIGQKIGSCVLERLIGYGGSSAVYLSHMPNAETGQEEPVAVKVFLPRSTLDGQMRKSFYQRFLREAEAASQLDHPSILSIYAYGEHHGLPYIIMPYMAGGTLAEYVRKHGPLALQEAHDYIAQVASAIDYAHQNGCVHCDIKPANLLLNQQGKVALSDFGIVRLLDKNNPSISLSQPSGKTGDVLMGTPDYISPEQALGEHMDGRSDIYSLGATLYFLLTGAPPFESESPIALALMHVHETPTPLGLLRADVTPQIDFVLSKVMAKWPEERFQTAEAFAEAFQQAIHEANATLAAAAKAEHASRGFEKGDSGTIRSSIKVKSVNHLPLPGWRSKFTLGLIAVLLLGSLSLALFIGAINSAHSTTPGKLINSTNTPDTPYDNLASNQANWPSSSTFFFQSGKYHIQNKLPTIQAMAFYENSQYTNFDLSITMREITGSYDSVDYYGVAFRASADQSHYYLFEITAGYNGQYDFLRHDGGNSWKHLASDALPNFHTKPGEANVLEILVNGNSFTFSMNGTQIGAPLHDTFDQPLSSGGIGLDVEKQNTEVAFSNLYIKPLK